MDDRKVVVPTDVYDQDGNMVRIDFKESDGSFAFQALWDHRDEQTGPNREQFRLWGYLMAKRFGYEVLK